MKGKFPTILVKGKRRTWSHHLLLTVTEILKPSVEKIVQLKHLFKFPLAYNKQYDFENTWKTQGFVFFSFNRIHTIGRVLHIERGKILPFFFYFQDIFFSVNCKSDKNIFDRWEQQKCLVSYDTANI